MRGYDPDKAPPLPDGFPMRMMAYDSFAEKYGWTPDVVDGLTLQQLDWLPLIAGGKGEARGMLADDD